MKSVLNMVTSQLYVLFYFHFLVTLRFFISFNLFGEVLAIRNGQNRSGGNVCVYRYMFVSKYMMRLCFLKYFVS